MNMTKHKLGELIDVTRGASLSGKYYAEDGSLIRLTLGNFNQNGGGFKENTSKTDIFFTGDVKAEHILNKGDIITPLTEQSLGLLGTTARIPESGKYIQSQDIALVKCKEGLLDPDFCYYLISSKAVRQQLSAAAQQTKIRHSSPDKIKDCTVWIPDFAQQKKVGRILTDIDSKIALNRQINDNLEAMAKQLYDYWFVQFDFPNEESKPYKSSGGAMVWNEKLKREIPQGWNAAKLVDVAQTYSGGTPTSTNKEYYDGGDIPWINSGELNYPIITSTPNYITERGLNNSSAKLYPPYTVLVALYGATAGKVSLLSFEACSNQAVCGVIPNDNNMTTYTRYYLASLYKHFIALSSGSARDNISQDTIKNTVLLIPQQEIIKKYSDTVAPIINKIITNQQETENLTKQRDELLPLLMNGQASVNYHLSDD